MVMDQHLIALDLDGTTLNNQSKLTNETIITLRALARDGHIVSIITGRPYRIAKHIYDEIGIKTPMVNFNGALTHIPHEHWDKEYDVELTRELALDLLAHRKELGLKQSPLKINIMYGLIKLVMIYLNSYQTSCAMIKS